MLSTILALLSFTYLASAADEGSAFGDDAPVVAPKRSKLTLRKPTPQYEDSESAFGDVDYLKDVSEKKPAKQEPVDEGSAFGDVDYLRDVVEDAHAAPGSKPALRKKHAPAYDESSFGDGLPADHGESFDEKEIQQLGEEQSLVEESALGGELKDDAEDDLDDKDMKAQSQEPSLDDDALDSGDFRSAPMHDSEQGLDAMWNTKSGFSEDAEDASAFGGNQHELRSEEVRPSNAKGCVGSQCEAEKWSPVRNVHAYGPSGKPANWKPRRILGGNRAELMSDEPARERGPRVYSRHMAVEHKSPPKRSLGEFMSSLLER